MTKLSMEPELGCGLTGRIFQRWSNWRRRTPSLPAKSSNNETLKAPVVSKKPPVYNPKRQQSTSVDSSLLYASDLAKPLPKQQIKFTRKPDSVPPRPSTSHLKGHSRRPSDTAVSSTLSSSLSGQPKVLQKESPRSSTELTRMIKADNQQANDSKALVPATSSNLTLSGRCSRPKPTDRHSKLGGNGVMGNIVRQGSDGFQQCHGLTKTLDPEVLKKMGNEAYKQGKFQQALALYERAISLDSKKATYRSNKSAALIALGHLIEAVIECEEAIRLDPTYQRAHQRLATLYLRLGDAEKALYHYKQSGLLDFKGTAQAQAVQEHMTRCKEARKFNEWKTLLKETHYAISYGADSAPQVYALQAEALLNLQRHEEAYTAYRKAPKICSESCIKFFGLAVSSYLLMIGAQVYLAAGRFEDALTAVQQAARLDPSNKEVNAVLKRAGTVASARLSGNLLFRASKYTEACIVYSQGLEHDPYNSVLLCNRAACRYKLGLFEKAVEDCTAALNMQPSYSKARLRRADCNAKLERWEAAIQDYEMLIRETPGDEEVGKALFETRLQLKKLHGEDVKDLKFGSNLVSISSNERFRHFVTSPGMTVVLFSNKEKHKQVLQLLEQVCKRFPSVNFLKVEVEDHPYIAKSEGVSSVPAFKIYKNGSRVKEIPGNNRDLLEKSVKLFSS